MTLTNAPAIITQLSTQLAACAGWTTTSATHWYPNLPASGATFPAAVLFEDQRTSSIYAAGAGGLQGGTLGIHIYSSGTIGQVEDLGRTILGQLLAQFVGIPWDSSNCGLSSDTEPGMVAASSDIRDIVLNLPYGLRV